MQFSKIGTCVFCERHDVTVYWMTGFIYEDGKTEPWSEWLCADCLNAWRGGDPYKPVEKIDWLGEAEE